VAARPTFVDVWSEALSRLRQGPVPPLVLLAGEAAHPKERLIEAAVAGSGCEAEPFSVQPGENEARAFQRLLDDWGTPMLFGSGRLLVVRDAAGLVKNRLPKLMEHLEHGDPPHRLLLCLPNVDGRSKLAKHLKRQGGLVSLPPLRDSPPPWHRGGPFLETDLNQWIVAEGRLQGLAVALPAAAALASRLGNEPGRIAQKLAQLALLVGDTLRPEDVAAHVAHASTRLLTLYEEALQHGRVAEAAELADRMVHGGVSDPFGRLVTGAPVADVVLRGVCSNLARLLEAHESLSPELTASLAHPPWKRSADQKAALDAVLGSGGRRVFIERDLRRTREGGVRAAFREGLAALRALRDGEGASLHATSVRLARALAPRSGGRP